MDKILNKVEFKVKDLTLSDWGRKEIKLAEAEMPGLMSLRKEYSKFINYFNFNLWLNNISIN